MVRLVPLAFALVALTGCYGPYGNSQIGYRDRPYTPYAWGNDPIENSWFAKPTSKEETQCLMANGEAIRFWGRCHDVIPFEPFPEVDPDFAKCGLTKADIPWRASDHVDPKSLKNVSSQSAIDDLNRAKAEKAVENAINKAEQDLETERLINGHP